MFFSHFMLHTVKPVFKGHCDEGTTCDQGTLPQNGVLFFYVKEPVMNTFSRILRCPLKTGLLYFQNL